MLISPQLARDTLADLTKDCCLPLDAGELIPARGQFLAHGHVFVGDLAVRGYKDKGRWKYDDRDIRRVGQTLSALTIDASEMVEAQVPSRHYFDDRVTFDDWSRADWRRTLNFWIYAAARCSRQHESNTIAADYDPVDDFDLFDPGIAHIPVTDVTDVWSSRYEIGPHGLPGDLTFEELVSLYGERTIAGTRPLKLLTWSQTHWVLPRTYTDMLDRWQERDRALTDGARTCTGCQRQGSRWAWRTPTHRGYVTLCPACSGETFQSYKGHLYGVAYSALRRKQQRADDYLCCLCRESRASVWDHCHEHSYVRGPVCASCNTFEGKGTAFLCQDGSVQHLLECRGCREACTLPRRFHLDVVLEHLEDVERHGRCRRRPHAFRSEYVHGVHQVTLSCPVHSSPSSWWTKQVTAAEAAGIVRAFVDKTLAGPSAD
ncbi:endonuclease domain-containing protein [Streptomyces sp. NBC_00120]|uniref:endonuclease domain-containing protein n=1 Tax=Streptomyces sp. NBC_00120 TaxID=2975660 RepID=UPI002259EF41|nr:endonuclease domain-containing protein [Streptomyces sp. NBC_00120]MCX5326317.1 endonuclease VII domain-containing protein [Streptomyces sp. NBC_00120]